MFFVAILFCLPVAKADSIEIELSPELKFGGHHIRIQYPGEAGVFVVKGGNQVIAELQSSGLLLQTEYLYLPRSNTEYRIKITPDYPLAFKVTEVQITRTKSNSDNPTPLQCHELEKQLAEEINKGEYKKAIHTLEEKVGTAKLCDLYHLAKGDALFNLEAFPEARSAYLDAYLELGSPTQNRTAVWMDYVASYLQLKLGFSEILTGDETSTPRLIDQGWETLRNAARNIEEHRHTNLLPELHNAKATYYRIIGDLVKASEELKAAVIEMREAGRMSEAANYLNNIATLHRARGDYSAAQRIFSQSIQLARKSKNHIAEAIQHDNLASTYVELGDLEAAERYFQASIELSELQGLAHKSADARLGLAELALLDDEVEKALRYLKDIENFATNQTFRIAGRLYAFLSEVYAKKGDAELSEKYTNRALTALSMQGRKKDKLRLIFALARSCISGSNYPLAETLLAQAESLLVPDHPHQVEFYQLKNALLLSQESIYSEVYAEQIRENFSKAFKIVRRTEQTLSFYHLGPGFKNRVRGLINDYLDFLLLSRAPNAVSEAFSIMEAYQASMMRKSRLFYRQFYIQNIETQTSRTQDYARAELQLLINDSDQSRLQGLRELDQRQEVLDASQGMDDFVIEKRVLLPKFNIAELSGTLMHDEALIRYFDLAEQTVVVVITQKGQIVFPLKKATRDILERQSLSELLGLPAESVLPTVFLSDSNVSKLVIITDHLSHLIPYSALKLRMEKKFINDRFQVIRAYSAVDYLDQNQSSPSEQQNHIAVFADPIFSDATDKTTGIKVPEWGVNLPRLVFSIEEVKSLKSHYPYSPLLSFTGRAATSDILMSHDTRSARLLHIATHGFYDPDYPGIVGLFTSYAESQHYLPGFISLTQLLSQPFFSDLVVLSGCDTLRGELWLSEGHNSLSRGVLAQGAGSALATLWKVPDRASAAFMEYFYRELARTGNSPEALQVAKQNLAKSGRFRAPHYWSGFVLTVANRIFETVQF